MGRNLEFCKVEKIKKATDVFWEKGFNGASMQDLVDAMQINRSSLYNTIGDKQDLFVECLIAYSEEKATCFEEKAKLQRSAFKAIEDFINESAEQTIQGCSGCFGTKSSFELAEGDTKVKAILKQANLRMLTFLGNLIANAQQSGEIKSMEDPEMLAEYIFSSFAGWRQSFVCHENPLKVKKMAALLIKHIKEG